MVSNSVFNAKGFLFTYSGILFISFMTLSASAQSNADRSYYEMLSKKHNEIRMSNEVKRQHSNEMSIKLNENRDIALYHKKQINPYLQRKVSQLKYKNEISLPNNKPMEGGLRINKK